MLKFVIVEDLVLTRIGIKTALKKNSLDCEVVAEVGSVKEAKTVLKQQHDIDVVLLDLILPDGNGIEIARFIKKRYPEIKILVISADTERENILALIKLGINGFISKFEDLPIIETAIYSVCNGIDYFGKDICEVIHAVSMSKAPKDNMFTARELEIMQLCAKGHTVKKIADLLCISPRTVDAHKNNIFRKMGFKNTGELVNYMYEQGIIRS
jgi:DNA-binding NarL/FixJ family response regulator